MLFRPLIRRCSPWLTIYFLVVSVGLPLQRVYCMCMGEQWISLTEADHECEHKAKLLAVADHHKMACCTAAKGCMQAEENHDCGDREVIMAQLDADFTYELTDWSVKVPALEALPALPYWQQAPNVTWANQRVARGPDPPPKLIGRALLVAHQTFLI